MKKLLCIILTLVTITLTGCGFGDSTIRFGAAGLGGMYYSFSTAFTELATKENNKLKFDIKTTAGSAANLRLLSKNYIDVGISQMDLIDDAYYGTPEFNGKKYNGYSAIAGLYKEACQIVVLDKSSIKTLDDLQDKTVSIGASESGTELNATQILKASGLWDNNLVKTKNLDYTDAAKQLEDGEIDAFFCTSGVQTTVIEELAKHANIRFIDIDSRHVCCPPCVWIMAVFYPVSRLLSVIKSRSPTTRCGCKQALGDLVTEGKPVLGYPMSKPNKRSWQHGSQEHKRSGTQGSHRKQKNRYGGLMGHLVPTLPQDQPRLRTDRRGVCRQAGGGQG